MDGAKSIAIHDIDVERGKIVLHIPFVIIASTREVVNYHCHLPISIGGGHTAPDLFMANVRSDVTGGNAITDAI